MERRDGNWRDGCGRLSMRNGIMRYISDHLRWGHELAERSRIWGIGEGEYPPPAPPPLIVKQNNVVTERCDSTAQRLVYSGDWPNYSMCYLVYGQQLKRFIARWADSAAGQDAILAAAASGRCWLWRCSPATFVNWQKYVCPSVIITLLKETKTMLGYVNQVVWQILTDSSAPWLLFWTIFKAGVGPCQAYSLVKVALTRYGTWSMFLLVLN